MSENLGLYNKLAFYGAVPPKDAIGMANSADSDLTAVSKIALGLHCWLKPFE